MSTQRLCVEGFFFFLPCDGLLSRDWITRTLISLMNSQQDGPLGNGLVGQAGVCVTLKAISCL